MLKNVLKPLILLLFLSLALSCEKDDTSETFNKQKFNAPSIEKAKNHVSKHSKLAMTGNIISASKNTNLIQTDWASSSVEDYIESSSLDVDILYTPIYLNTDANAKAFIASVEKDGQVESNLFCLIYKENPFGPNGLSSYVFVYNLDGKLEKAYNFQDGQPIPFEHSKSTTAISKLVTTKTDCNTPLADPSFEVMNSWLEECGGMLDEVNVTTIDAGSSGGGGNIYDGSFLPDIGSVNWGHNDPYNAGGGASAANPIPLMPSLVSADPISIALAIDAEYMSEEASWLRHQLPNEQTQQLLEAIAAFLNMNKAKDSIDSSVFQNVSNNQVPNIRQEAQDFVLDLIGFLMENTSLNGSNNFTDSDYPGKEDGLPFEWWEDDTLISDNIDFNLDDDPNYQGLTEQEKLLVKIFPTLAYHMSKNKVNATNETINRFGFNGRNDKSDSFRHAYFNALNTRSATFSVVGDGGEVVRLFGVAHESETPNNLIKEVIMDLHNNDQGVGFCSDCWPGLTTDIEISNGIWNLLQNGDLWYLNPLTPPIAPPNFGITNETQNTPTNQ